MLSTLRVLYIAMFGGVVWLAVALALKFPIVWLVYAVLLFVKLRKPQALTSHGTARWATSSEVKRHAHDTGLVVGYLRRETPLLKAIWGLFTAPAEEAVKCWHDIWKKPQWDLIKLRPVHTSVFIPSGGGKGQGHVLPTLMNDTRSMVVIDPKGEACLATAQARREMGHRVVILDPFGIRGGEDSLNPLAEVSDDPSRALDDVKAIATALIPVEKTDANIHFPQNARFVEAVGIAGVLSAMPTEAHNLGTVNRVLSSEKLRAACLEDMSKSSACGGYLPQMAHQMAEIKDRELSSTLSTLNTHTQVLNTPAIHRVTCRSTFKSTDLLDDLTTVFIVVPPEKMESLRGVMKMWIGTLMRGIMARGIQRGKEVVFHIDEASLLGDLPEIKSALSVGRGYGISVNFYFQSVGQLREAYPEGGDQTILGNTCNIFAGIGDYQTAEYVSNILGTYTDVVSSWGTNWGVSTTSGNNQSSISRNYGGNNNQQQQARELQKPAELLAADPRVAVIRYPGLRPFTVYTARAWEGDRSRLKTSWWMVAGLFISWLAVMILLIWFVNHLGEIRWGN